MSDAPTTQELPDVEVGCLNDLDSGQVLRGVQHIRSGEVSPQQAPMGRQPGQAVEGTGAPVNPVVIR